MSRTISIHRRTLLVGSSAVVEPLSLGALSIWAKAAVGVPEQIPSDGSFPKLAIGMNLSGIAYWEPGFPFRDLLLSARPWLTRNLSSRGPFDTGAQNFLRYNTYGYPLEVPVAVTSFSEPQTVFTFLPARRGSEKHVLPHHGEGELDGFSSLKIFKRSPERLRLEMNNEYNNMRRLAIKRSNSLDHVQNIRIVT